MRDLQRFPDWPQRLAHALEARRALPHVWGENDCALFAASMVEAITGVDFGAEFRGQYSDEAGAREMMEAWGWADLAALADDCLPPQEGRARRGDVVLVDGRFGPFLGVVWSGGVIGPGPRHAILWPAAQYERAWRVG